MFCIYLLEREQNLNVFGKLYEIMNPVVLITIKILCRIMLSVQEGVQNIAII